MVTERLKTFNLMAMVSLLSYLSLHPPFVYLVLISSLSTDHFEQTKFENGAPGLGKRLTSIVMARLCW